MWENVDFDEIDKGLLAEAVEKILITCLTERETKVVIYRYWAEMSTEEMSKILKVTKSRIHQIILESIKKLRNAVSLNILVKCGVLEAEKIIRQSEKDAIERKKLVDECQKNWRRQQERERWLIRIRRPKIFFKYLKDTSLKEADPPVSSIFPPKQVVLKRDILGTPYLATQSPYVLHRDRAPEIYDRWLAYLISKENLPSSNI